MQSNKIHRKDCNDEVLITERIMRYNTDPHFTQGRDPKRAEDSGLIVYHLARIISYIIMLSGMYQIARWIIAIVST